MTLRKTSTLFGSACVLAAASLVALTSSSAQAVDSSYNCTLVEYDIPMGAFTMTVTAPGLPATGTAGQPLAPGAVNLDAAFILDAASAAGLMAQNVDGAKIKDYSLELGDSVKVPLSLGAPTPNDDGSFSMSGGGDSARFSMPAAGTYDIALPESFTVTPTTGGKPAGFTLGCESGAPGSLGTIDIAKASSSMSAKARGGQKVVVSVSRETKDVAASGKVKATLGKKTYVEKLNGKGKAVFEFAKSAKGKKVSFTYAGDGYTEGAEASTTVR